MGCGTIMQLVGYGSQDIYLTGNPQITNFKFVYKRYTNFSKEYNEEVFTNDIKINIGNSNSSIYNQKTFKASCTISEKGDLLHKVYLVLDIHFNDPTFNKNHIVSRSGHSIIHSIELEIGGNIVDKLYGQWIDIWTQLSYNKYMYYKYNKLINSSIDSYNHTDIENINKKNYINLPFWFSKNSGMALPIIALYKNEIKINIIFNSYISISKKPINDKSINIKPSLLCEYIYLDNDERKLFTNSCQEYLVENIQKSELHVFDKNQNIANIRLKFNHPVKELIWICQDSFYIYPGTENFFPFAFNIYSNNQNQGGDFVNFARLLFNNNDRFKKRDGTYFRIVQPYQHHSGAIDNQIISSKEKGYIYCYSFSINPQENQPSGTCNFSRIDDPILILNLNQSIGQKKYVQIYAINYNIFSISNGMGGLLFT